MHVKGELNSEDLIEKVRRGRRCPRIDGQMDYETKLGCGKRERERNRRSKRGETELFRGCNKCESLGEGPGTAVLRTAADGRLAGHVAVGTHAAHGHWAAGDTCCGCALHTGQSGHCGLNRQEANQQNRRELDVPFHPVIVKIVGRVCRGLCFGSHPVRGKHRATHRIRSTISRKAARMHSSLRQHFNRGDGGVTVDRNKGQNQLALRIRLEAGESPDHDV